MLDAMSRIALDHLREQLPDDPGDKSDPWKWYLRVREERPQLLFPYLVEPPRGSLSPNCYVLSAAPDEGVAILEQRERREGDDLRLPFVQSTGSQSGALGPVIKRTYAKGKGPGPSRKINETTIKGFRGIADAGELWSDYFGHVSSVISRPWLRFRGDLIGGDGASALNLAVREIGERQTCLLSVLDAEGKLPGEVDEYLAYLQHVLAVEKYSTGKLKPVQDGTCALSGERGTVYPNALAGAGLNISNVDRLGVFPGLDDADAWKKFALSAEVADLLFVYSFHVRDRFLARVAGERALLVPYTSLDPDKRLRFVKSTRERYVPHVQTGESIIREENKLERLAGEEGAVTTITILWADFGQKLDNVRGMVTDVLPSRLRTISGVVREVNADRSVPFPELEYEGQLRLDVALNYLGQLLKRPGGKRTEKANKGPRLFDLKRDMAAAVYQGRQVPEERFWKEVRDVFEAYLLDALERRDSYGLFNEGRSKKGEIYLTMAGWARHLCRFLYFLRKLEVYPQMDDWRYAPRTERFRRSFDDLFQDANGRTGIDRPEKAYAFLLGALFGKLIQVQGARGVNVGANALPWLKRFTLTGKDLPELYVKIREKLITYGTESSVAVRDLEEELGHLGTLLGTDIKLNQTETGYFLLLGQSLSRNLMPTDGQGRVSTDGEGTQ
ncbi:MAG: CRISPR-associated protein [Actinomycetota bacterium]|nr:CRISPR-associated protein [Actinomycetota bacterium]